VPIASWWGHLKERENLEDKGEHRRIILKEFLKEQDERACSGLIRPTANKRGGLL
jgi:hypothetical protein